MTCLILTGQCAPRELAAARPGARAPRLAGCSARAAARPVRFLLSKPEAIPYFRDLIEEYNSLAERRRGRARHSASNLQAGFLRGNPPDLGLLNYNMEMARFMERGALSDLSDMPEADRILPEVPSRHRSVGATPAAPACCRTR